MRFIYWVAAWQLLMAVLTFCGAVVLAAIRMALFCVMLVLAAMMTVTALLTKLTFWNRED